MFKLISKLISKHIRVRAAPAGLCSGRARAACGARTARARTGDGGASRRTRRGSGRRHEAGRWRSRMLGSRGGVRVGMADVDGGGARRDNVLALERRMLYEKQ